ncbi:MAG: glycosyltransferase family 2 protein, partial [Macrococcoides caseolyticum]
MKISIIIPIYNQEEYIVDTIISVKNQTFKNFECILINDGSTDDSQKIVEREIIDDSR